MPGGPFWEPSAPFSVAGDGKSEPTALPLTFVELQSWLNPKAGGAGESAMSATMPGVGVNAANGVSGQANSVAGLFSGLLTGASGQKAQSGSGGVSGDATLTDVMKASVLTDSGRNADSGSLINSGRFNLLLISTLMLYQIKLQAFNDI